MESARGRLPVIAGVGYGTALAIEFAQRAEKAGADGVLLLPHYLVQAEQEWLYRHIVAICSAVGVGVIVYHRERLQRKELSGTSGRAKASGIVTDEIVDVLPVPVWRKRAIIGEMGDREGQQTRPDDFKR